MSTNYVACIELDLTVFCRFDSKEEASRKDVRIAGKIFAESNAEGSALEKAAYLFLPRARVRAGASPSPRATSAAAARDRLRLVLGRKR